MRPEKLFQSLRLLSKEEIRHFRKFVKSPYFNSNKTLIRLADYVVQFHPDFSDKKLEKPAVWKKLKTGKPFSASFLTNRMSDLNKLVTRFLVVQSIEKEPEAEKAIIRALDNRGDYERWSKLVRNRIKKLKEKEHSPTVFWEFQDLYRQLYEHPKTIQMTTASDLPRNIKSCLDLYFITQTLNDYCDLASREITFSESHEFPMLEGILKRAFELKNDYSIINLYLQIIPLLESDFEEKQFIDTLDFAQSAFHGLHQTQQASVIIKLINSANKKVTEGHVEYLSHIHKINQIGVENELHIQDEIIADETFLNIGIVAAACKDFIWLKRFVEENQSRMNVEVREIALSTVNVYSMFHQGFHEKTLQYLTTLKSPRLAYKIRFKSLEIRCLYEILLSDNSYEEVLNSRLDAFRQFLNRNRDYSKKRKQAYYNFIDFVRALSEIHLQSGQAAEKAEKIARLRVKLIEAKSIVLKSWLFQKLKPPTKETPVGIRS